MTLFSTSPSRSALLALQVLRQTDAEMETVSSRLLGVISPSDPAYSLARSLESNLEAYKGVQSSIATARAVVKTASTAATQISDLFTQLKNLAQQAAGNISSDERNTLNDQFKSLRDQLQVIVDNATYGGKNLITDNSTSYTFTSNINGGTTTIAATPDIGDVIEDFLDELDRSGNSNDDIKSQSAAQDTLDFFNNDDVLGRIGAAVSSLASGAKSVDFVESFNKSLADITSEHLNSLMDVDLAAESAKLEALKVREQLALQVLSIANQRPNLILSLFQN